MKLSDALGSIDVDIEQAKKLFEVWFEPDDLIVLSGRRVVRQNGFNDNLSATLTRDEFMQMSNEEIQNLVVDQDGEMWNLYFGVCPVESAPDLRRRTTESIVSKVRGLYVDIDVKMHAFESQEQILQFLDSLPFYPTAVVSTGSGGIHAYWKLSDSPQDTKEQKALITAWWSYLDEAAGHIYIDKLIDLARVLRLPGSVRFPKEGTSEVPSPVKLMHISDASYDYREILKVSASAVAIKEARRIELRKQERLKIKAVEASAHELFGWKALLAYSKISEWISENLTWDEILIPHGWKDLNRVGSNGARQFARPGSDEKSCTVDFEESPDVMSLFSTSDETRLHDILDAGIYLSKYRVHLRLQYNDDIDAMVRDYGERVLNDS